MQKKLKGMHVETTNNAMAAWEYCTSTGAHLGKPRVEGPWSKGMAPAKLNVKGDKAKRNKALIHMGAAQAVDEGIIDIKDYLKVKANIEGYKNDTHTQQPLSELNNLWLWGPSGTGKTRYVCDTYPNYYEKDKSKYWNGYKGQDVVLIDELETDQQFMLGMLKMIA